MSRPSGQVRPLQAVLGALVLIGLLWLITAGAQALMRPGEQVPPLEAPAQPQTLTCPDPADGQDPLTVTAEELIECPDVYDGRQVRYRGEVVRAVLERGPRAWVQLNDDPYALTRGPLPEHRTAIGGNSGVPVSLPADAAAMVEQVGDFRAQGDVLEVLGTFRRGHPDDAGAPAIHAEAVEAVRAGHEVEHDVDPVRAVVAAVATSLALMLSWLARRSRRS